MRALLLLPTLSIVATLAVGAFGIAPRPAHADVAERCGYYGCSYIRCNHTGDYCRRFDDYRGARDDSWRYERRYGRHRHYSRYGYDSSNWERHRRYQRWYGHGGYGADEYDDRSNRAGCYDRRYCENYDRSWRGWYDDD